MTKVFVVALTAVLMQSAVSFAGDKSTDSRAKPSSFVPHPHTTTHVYGAPIQPAIVSHSRVAHHNHTPKKRTPIPKKTPSPKK
jgi:hypothetical protein